MSTLRLWDAEMNLKHTETSSDEAKLRHLAELFLAGYADSDWLHFTIDHGEDLSFKARQGGRLTRRESPTSGMDFRWEDNREYLRRILMPDAELAKYQLDKPLGPGDKIAFEVGGLLYTDTIESIHTETPKREPTPAPRRPWWRRVLRALTPRRYREPELWAPPGGNLPSTVITIGDGQPYQLGRDIVLGERHDLTDPAYWTDEDLGDGRTVSRGHGGCATCDGGGCGDCR